MVDSFLFDIPPEEEEAPLQFTHTKGLRIDDLSDMAVLTQALTGTPLPLEALFDWLRGQATPASGWAVDLSAHAEGRLIAQRREPLPTAELRLRLHD